MAALHPLVWIVVGTLILAVSMFIDNLRFFALIGGLFIIIGLIKLAFTKRTPRESKPEHTFHTQAPSSDLKKRCFVCASHNSSKANFCGHCGHRLQ